MERDRVDGGGRSGGKRGEFGRVQKEEERGMGGRNSGECVGWQR